MGGTYYYGGESLTLDSLKTQQEKTQPSNKKAAEDLLSKLFRDDLGVEINAQALRMFIRSRWERISTLAHAIHDGT